MSKIGPIAPFNTIGRAEIAAAIDAIKRGPLSGYLGGGAGGGYYIQKLENEWAAKFGVKHAIACNSATSGLMAAAFAVGLGSGDRFLCSPYTMSAGAAAPMFTGATPLFWDISPNTFNIDPLNMSGLRLKAVFLTHLFGMGIDEGWWAGWAHQNGYKVVVDASQSPFSMYDGVYNGTIGDIGIFSLNIHKHIQAGEGGIIVTNNDDLAHCCRSFINHGEMAGGAIGLNLRMTEPTAAIACVQLSMADKIISDRIELAMRIIDAVDVLPWPYIHPDVRHVFYAIPWLVPSGWDRDAFVRKVNEQGVPLRAGYVEPLYKLPAFQKYASPCPVTEDVQKRLVLWENCAWTPTNKQIKQIGAAFRKATHEH